MLGDPDLQKLAVESRQKLIKEFAETYVSLRERVKRVPEADARRIAEEYSCPVEIAMIAYIIEMDSIMSAREAVGLMASELERRAEVGESVPNLPGNVMEFALVEGRWISHIHGPFTRMLERQTRSLANEEESLNSGEEIQVERALSIIAARTKLAETVILPTVQEWLKDHLKAQSSDVIHAFGLAITKWNPSTLNGKFIQLQRRNQALFRLLHQSLTQVSDSYTIDSSIVRLEKLITELEQPLDNLTERAVAHFLLHIIPRQTSGRGDRSQYVTVGASSTRGNKAEPDLTSPFDFLERDVKLGIRRTDRDERRKFLYERIGRVIRVLKYQENTAIEGMELCLKELKDRFGLADIPLDSTINSSKEKLVLAPMAERDSLVIAMIHDFIVKNIYEEEVPKE